MAHHTHHHAAATDDPPTMHDVDSVGSLFVVYLVVLGLAVANILLATTHMGRLALPVQLGIGTVQAVIVAWYWMHMRRKDTIVTLTAVTSLFFIFIFYVLVLSDVLTRHLGGI